MASERPLKRKSRLGYRYAASRAAQTLIRNERKIATPPKRGSGLLCMCRSWLGGETHPRAVAQFRTPRVSTNDRNSENPKIPRKKSVNQFPFGQRLGYEVKLNSPEHPLNRLVGHPKSSWFRKQQCKANHSTIAGEKNTEHFLTQCTCGKLDSPSPSNLQQTQATMRQSADHVPGSDIY